MWTDFQRFRASRSPVDCSRLPPSSSCLAPHQSSRRNYAFSALSASPPHLLNQQNLFQQPSQLWVIVCWLSSLAHLTCSPDLFYFTCLTDPACFTFWYLVSLLFQGPWIVEGELFSHLLQMGPCRHICQGRWITFMRNQLQPPHLITCLPVDVEVICHC